MYWWLYSVVAARRPKAPRLELQSYENKAPGFLFSIMTFAFERLTLPPPHRILVLVLAFFTLFMTSHLTNQIPFAMARPIRALVLGGTGFLGQHIVHTLQSSEAQPFDVTVASSRPIHELQLPAGVRVVQLDFMSPAIAETAAAVLADVNPDVIINAAALSDLGPSEKDPQAAKLINAPALFYAAVPRSVRLVIHFSTDIVYNGDKPRGQAYAEPEADPVNVYGCTKLEGEAVAMDSVPPGVPVIVLRAALILGSKARQVGPSPPKDSAVQGAYASLRSGTPIRAFEDEYRTPVAAADLAATVMAFAVAFAAVPPTDAGSAGEVIAAALRSTPAGDGTAASLLSLVQARRRCSEAAGGAAGPSAGPSAESSAGTARDASLAGSAPQQADAAAASDRADGSDRVGKSFRAVFNAGGPLCQSRFETAQAIVRGLAIAGADTSAAVAAAPKAVGEERRDIEAVGVTDLGDTPAAAGAGADGAGAAAGDGAAGAGAGATDGAGRAAGGDVARAAASALAASFVLPSKVADVAFPYRRPRNVCLSSAPLAVALAALLGADGQGPSTSAGAAGGAGGAGGAGAAGAAGAVVAAVRGAVEGLADRRCKALLDGRGGFLAPEAAVVRMGASAWQTCF